ncbi:MAG: MFS transporter [Calditrichales bacterium]|nr:MAG: MFS transporter [Calditrichales bacterium]
MAKKKRSGWWWIPSLYYAEGIPYIVVMTVSVIFYKRMGISNTDIALYTSWLYLPWVIKPFWSPVVDMLRTKRFWIITMQLIIGAGLGGVALTIPLPGFFKYTLLFLWLLAFSSATHDIAADGFYMLGLGQRDQAWFVGIRSTFYRFAMITGQGLLIILAGYIESNSGLESKDISVVTGPQIETHAFIHPDSIKVSDSDGPLSIVTFPKTVQIAAIPTSKAKVDSINRFVRQWNVANAHVTNDSDQMSKSLNGDEISWWTSNITEPFETFVVKYFGQERKVRAADNAGNIGLVYFSLSKKPEPGEEIVMNFGRESGDKSISLNQHPAGGSRLVFTEQNWDKPALAIIEIDPKLKRTSEATFTVYAGNIPLAWSITFLALAGLFMLFFVYHKFALPFPAADKASVGDASKNYMKEFFNTFVLFFKKDNIGAILGFLLLFRLAESQIVKLASPFLLDAQEAGGLALTTGEVGLVYGTIGILALTFGGLLGGFLAAKHGLKYWLWPMAIAINLPDLVYVYLSYAIPDNLFVINACVAVEQFGYGFGFTAYMLYMIFVAEGDHKTAHFAITTGFMALGMMIPGMVSGYIQDLIGYQHFFVWVMIATIPSFLILKLVRIDDDFGKKDQEVEESA